MALTHQPDEATRPFLRWVGGKRYLVERLLRFLPDSVNSLRYVEPFVGAGALYFRLRPSTAVLSDANPHLISCYRAVRDKPELVARYLSRHQQRNTRLYYYQVRAQYNRRRDSAAQAARFIYLNATCFNGIFRVNRDGAFNVPCGDKPKPHLPSSQALMRLSKLLKKAHLSHAQYTAVFAHLRRGDFAFLDPPYPPLNGTAFFTHYTMDRFSQADHQLLADHVRRLDRQGVLFLLTNADTPEIRRLYRGFNMTPLSVTRYATCKAQRHKVTELLVSNYDCSR